MADFAAARTPTSPEKELGFTEVGGNSPGRPLVYTAEPAALAVLEVRVHLDLTWDLLPIDFVLMEIETAAAAIEDAAHVTDTIGYGDSWLDARQRRCCAFRRRSSPKAAMC